MTRAAVYLVTLHVARGGHSVGTVPAAVCSDIPKIALKASRKNEGMEPKQKQYLVVDGTGDRRKAQCYKVQYSIGTWHVKSMNQGKLEVGVLHRLEHTEIHRVG